MKEVHYSIRLKGEKLKLHGSFIFFGRLDKKGIRPELVKAIRERWGDIPFSGIESLECYYFEAGKEIAIE